MKELLAGIQLVRTKGIQLNRHPVLKKKALKPVAVESLPQQGHDCPKGAARSNRPKRTSKGSRQKRLMSLPVGVPLEVLQQRTTEGLRRLKHQGIRINQLSAELEEAMLEFKAIASEVNREWKAIQAMQEPTSAIAQRAAPKAIAEICEYQAVNVPKILQKPSGSFLLTSYTVDLFKAERDAALLAQALRHRAQGKQVKS
jgi:hypothetical protein